MRLTPRARAQVASPAAAKPGGLGAIQSRLQELGDDGWELISYTEVGLHGGFTGARKGTAYLGGCGSDPATTITHTVAGPTGSTGVSGPAHEQYKERADPTEVVRRYYSLVNDGRYEAAWPLLPQGVQEDAGGFSDWKQGYAATVFTDADTTLRSKSGSSAVVAVRVSSAARDVCTHDPVRQGYAGTWTLTRDGDHWTAVDARIDQVSGGTPTLVASECEAPPPTTTTTTTTKPPKPVQSCTPGYSPCLAPASDYDCSGGTGDGPEYSGQVSVSGSDPYDLDADGDGIGCE
jgi:hypothetical protein